MSENDRLDVLSLNTIFPSTKVAEEMDVEVKPGKWVKMSMQKWALAFQKWKQVDPDRCPSWTPLHDDHHVVLYTTNRDPEKFFAVEREPHYTECIVPKDVPLKYEIDPDTGFKTVVPSMGEWSELGKDRWEPIEAAMFSDAALAMCVNAGQPPFVPKVWKSIMRIHDLDQWADLYRRIASWREVNRERVGEPNAPRDAGDADEVFNAFLNSL